VDVDWGCVWWGSFLHTTYYLLAVILVVDVGGHYFLVCVVVAGNVKRIEAEGGRVVGEIGKSRVVIFFDFRFSMVVDGFFYHFNTGGGTGETLEHGDEAGLWCFSDGIGGRDYEWRGSGNMNGG